MEYEIAEALIEINGVGFRTDNPITFKSGMKSPVYCDNRAFPFWPKQWAKVTPRADSAIIALYTDYESDERGEYTFVLGSKAAAASEIPEGKVLKTVPAGRYAVFTSERGPVQRVVVETWQRIWSELQSRSFVADFEVHDQRAADPTNAVVDIYVGVK